MYGRGVDGGSAARWLCALDRRCSFASEALAVDTSHVCVLVRAASLLACDEPTLAQRFQELLTSHTCGGSHRLMTSQALLSNDNEMNLASPHSALRRYGDLPIGSLELIEPVEGGNGNDLPLGVPGDRDRTLVAAAVVVSDAEGGMVMVVTDDEALADWVAEIAAGMSDADVDIWPASSIDLVDRMHECGAIGTPVVEAVSDAETTHLADCVLSLDLRQRKLARLSRVVVAAAARDARRDARHE